MWLENRARASDRRRIAQFQMAVPRVRTVLDNLNKVVLPFLLWDGELSFLLANMIKPFLAQDSVAVRLRSARIELSYTVRYPPVS